MIWAAVAFGLYLVVGAVVYLMQDALVFPGAWRTKGPVPQIAGVATERVVVSDTVEVRIAVAEADAPRAVVVHFTGNYEDLRDGIYHARMWQSIGLTAVVMEYPGYGESLGSLRVDTVLEAAEAVAEYADGLAEQCGGVPVIVSGNSLGTFAAVHVAAAQVSRGFGIEGVVLTAPPGDLRGVAQAQYPWLPARWLLRHRFDAIAKAPNVRVPGLILHGARDRVAPIEFGGRLAAAWGSAGAEFVRLEDGFHDFDPLVGGHVERFVATVVGGATPGSDAPSGRPK